MALYYFHLRDGKSVLLDPDGRDLPGLAEVRRAALRDARSIISGDVLDGLLALDQRIDVLDVAGRVVHQLPFADAVTMVHEPPPPPAG